MKSYLLDTHVLLWWAEGNPKISQTHRDLLEDPSVVLWLSVVSAWEASIKEANGKLHLPSPALEFFTEVSTRYGFKILPVQLSHATGVGCLPPLHSDPFDRLLISQARCESLILLTDDAAIRRYNLNDLEIC